VQGELDDDLGGRRIAKGLRKRVAVAIRLAEKARVHPKSKKQSKLLKKSGRKLVSFERKLVRGVDKKKIGLELAQTLTDMSVVARTRVETLMVAVLEPPA